MSHGHRRGRSSARAVRATVYGNVSTRTAYHAIDCGMHRRSTRITDDARGRMPRCVTRRRARARSTSRVTRPNLGTLRPNLGTLQPRRLGTTAPERRFATARAHLDARCDVAERRRARRQRRDLARASARSSGETTAASRRAAVFVRALRHRRGAAGATIRIRPSWNLRRGAGGKFRRAQALG